jgi:GT2 family glycosyltransferase
MGECLRSLAAADYSALEVIVVHNGPLFDGLREAAKAACPKVSEVVFTGANLGYAAGNNLGIREALARGAVYVLLLNDDTLVGPDLLSSLVGCAETKKEGGAFGPTILVAHQPTVVWFAGAEFNAERCVMQTPGVGQPPPDPEGEPRLSAYLTGCCVLIRRAVLEQVGLLDERFFLYWEDADWGLRAAAAGFKSFHVPAGRIWHRVSVSMGGPESPLKAYHRIRSHLLFAQLHTPRAFGRVQRRFLRDIAWLGLKSQDRGRWRLARAHVAALRDYHLGRTGRGPDWLWRGR